MQFTTAILALAATALAAPNLSSRDYQCQFGQYACSKDGMSIKQCDISGHWVVRIFPFHFHQSHLIPQFKHDLILILEFLFLQEVGPCGPNEICEYSDANYLPYCFSKTSKREDTREDKRAGNYPVCSNPGTYSCTYDNAGINVCNAQNQLVLNGWCPKGTHCAPLPSAGGIPFCVNN